MNESGAFRSIILSIIFEDDISGRHFVLHSLLLDSKSEAHRAPMNIFSYQFELNVADLLPHSLLLCHHLCFWLVVLKCQV